MQLKKINKIFFQIVKFFLIIFFINLFCSSKLLSKEIKIFANNNNIEKLLKLDPNNIDFLFIYAKKKEELNEYQYAENIYKKIISLSPENLRFYLDLARVQFLKFDYENSEKNFLYVYKKKIPPNVKYNIRNYLRILSKRKPSKINYTIKLSHNDNINNGTYADTVELFGVPFKIDENAKAKSSFELFTNINGYKNNYLYGQKINTGFDISFSDFKDDDYDRLKYSINFGPEFLIQNKMIILNYNFSQEKIGFNKVLNDNKLEMKSILNNKNSQFIYSLGANNNRFYSKEDYNTNGKFAKLSSNFFVNNRFTLGGAYKYSINDAINDYYSNEKNYYELFSSISLFKNFLIDALTGVEFSDYHEYQPLFSKTRKDKLKFINIDIKNDKIFIGKYMPQISLTLRENKSNVNVYQTNSNNISLYFVKEF